MKKYLFFLAVVALCSCKNEAASDAVGVQEIKDRGPNSEMVRNPQTAQGLVDESELPVIEFEEKEFDFGTANEGDIVEHAFAFKNTGKTALLITNCRASCGCTVPDWPKEPVQPGESGVITAKFNTSGKKENQNKVITVTANTFPSESTVSLRGFVNPKK